MLRALYRSLHLQFRQYALPARKYGCPAREFSQCLSPSSPFQVLGGRAFPPTAIQISFTCCALNAVWSRSSNRNTSSYGQLKSSLNFHGLWLGQENADSGHKITARFARRNRRFNTLLQRCFARTRRTWFSRIGVVIRSRPGRTTISTGIR